MSSDHDAAISEDAPAHDDAAFRRTSVFRQAWSGAAHLVLLTLLVVGLHYVHVLDLTEGYFRRLANEIHEAWEIDGRTFPRHANPLGPIQILEISAYLRASKLEIRDRQVDELKDAIDRLHGIRPIDRCELAKLLSSLAKNLPEASATSPRVVAIDIDLAPLNREDAQRCYSEKKPWADLSMETALLELHKKASVIAVAMDRDSPDERLVRNDFMRRTCPFMRYASPRIFHGFHDYPLDFPVQPNAKADYVFPSLGNLIRLAVWPGGNKASTKALSLLCGEVETTIPADAMILEDRIEPKNHDEMCLSGKADAACHRFDIAAFESAAFNFRWLGADFVLSHSITSLDAFDCQSADCIRAETLTAPVLLLSVDGGAQDDKYDVPQAAFDSVSGATLHALQAWSMHEGMALHLHSVITLLADLAAGVLFLLAWNTSKQRIEKLDPTSTLRFVLWLLVPAAIAGILCALFVFRISPSMLEHDIWINPAYVLLGLVLHAYVEVSHHTHGDHGVTGSAEQPDFSFGLRRLLKAGPELSHPSLPPAAERCDALLSAVLQWGVILVAMAPMLVLGEYGVSGRVFAAALITVALLLVGCQRFRRLS